MNLSAATIASLLLCAASGCLLWWADEPTDAAAVAAGTGMVVAGALLGLTLLAWRWRRGGAPYVATAVGVPVQVDAAMAFDPTTEVYASEDAAPRAAAR